MILAAAARSRNAQMGVAAGGSRRLMMTAKQFQSTDEETLMATKKTNQTKTSAGKSKKVDKPETATSKPAEPTTQPPEPESKTTSAETATPKATTEAKPKAEPKPKAKKEPSSKPKAKAESKPKKLSALDAAAKVLSETDQSLTCKELIEVMAAKGYWTSPGGKTPAATLSAAMLREIKTKGEQSRFQKTAPGKFGLRQGKEANK